MHVNDGVYTKVTTTTTKTNKQTTNNIFCYAIFKIDQNPVTLLLGLE